MSSSPIARPQYAATTSSAGSSRSGRMLPKALHLPRLPDLDALRGIMLIGMTLTHLPTSASHYSNQLLGFVSWAEGFVLLSALLAGRVFGGLLRQRAFKVMRQHVWLRGAKIYGYHVGLLAVAFTLVAAVAVHTHRPALLGLLDFYLAHRLPAVLSSLFLLYCPPLLDILPMYIVFLFATPMILGAGRRWSWRVVLVPSALLWLAAQLGAREMVYNFLVAHAGLRIPLQNLGAFNLAAWQLLWVAGLWVGAGQSTHLLKVFRSRWTIACAIPTAVIFLVMRYQLIPYFATHPVDQGGGWILFDKWQLGILRLLNFAVLAVLYTAVRPYIVRSLDWTPLVLLGRSSLEVFCTSLLFSFAALSLIGDGAGASPVYDTAVVTITFLGMYAVAYLRAQPKDRRSSAVPIDASKRRLHPRPL